jgi:hypothetical protein
LVSLEGGWRVGGVKGWRVGAGVRGTLDLGGLVCGLAIFRAGYEGHHAGEG